MDEHKINTIWQRIKALYNERNGLYVDVPFGGERCKDTARKGQINAEIIQGLDDLDSLIFPKIMKGLGR
jgi:hypothetical protein